MMRISLAQDIVDEASMEIEAILLTFGVKIAIEEQSGLLRITKDYDEHQFVSATLSPDGRPVK